MSAQKQKKSYIRKFVSALSFLPRRHVILTGTIIILLSLIILLVPFSTTVVPEWKVRVLNSQGKPVSGVRVRQTWKHYSLDLEPATNQEQEWSDETGYVVFPKRTITKGLLHRAVLIVLTGLMTLAHGSTGVSASVWAVTDKCSSEFLDYKSSKPLPDTVVLRCAE